MPPSPHRDALHETLVRIRELLAHPEDIAPEDLSEAIILLAAACDLAANQTAGLRDDLAGDAVAGVLAPEAVADANARLLAAEVTARDIAADIRAAAELGATHALARTLDASLSRWGVWVDALGEALAAASTLRRD